MRLTVPPHGTVTVVFHATVPRLLNRGSGNLCVTPSASTILVQGDHISRDTLVHEFGHIQQARRLGWRYLPWVLSCYARQGYANSTPERDADAWGAVFAHDFAHLPYTITETTQG